MGVLGRVSPILGTFAPQKPKIGRIGHPPGSKVQGGNGYRNRQRWQRVRSACVNNVRPRRQAYFFFFFFFFFFLLLLLLLFYTPGSKDPGLKN